MSLKKNLKKNFSKTLTREEKINILSFSTKNTEDKGRTKGNAKECGPGNQHRLFGDIKKNYISNCTTLL